MRTITLVLALALVAGACTYPGADVPDGPGPPVTAPPPGVVVDPPMPGDMLQDPVFIDSHTISVAESFPMQVFVQITGTMPTPCHTVVWTAEEVDGVFEVTIFSQIDMNVTCIAQVEPFDVNIKLGDSEGGSYDLVINGELVETFDV